MIGEYSMKENLSTGITFLNLLISLNVFLVMKNFNNYDFFSSSSQFSGTSKSLFQSIMT